MSEQKKINRYDAAVHLIKSCGGCIRMADALSAGINRYTLYSLRDAGVLELVSRGVYRISAAPPFSQPDKVTVALRAPHSAVCLLSALEFHGITTQPPRAVTIAIPYGTASPRIAYPPVQVYRLREPSFSAGITEHKIDGVTVKIYDVEKTLCDCFRFRNRLGMDIVLEALKLYCERKPLKVGSIMKYARINKVEKIIRPYLEAAL